jgi:hypothetical protein
MRRDVIARERSDEAIQTGEWIGLGWMASSLRSLAMTGGCAAARHFISEKENPC